jgi:hypothetical protein
LEDLEIWRFPDSSKLHHGRVMLEWRRTDLYGLTVPCRDADIEQRWRDAHTLETIELERERAASVSSAHAESPGPDEERFYLAPHALAGAPTDRPERALIEEFRRIGVIRRVDDDRVDIPDLFRVAAAIGRKGGVRPIR